MFRICIIDTYNQYVFFSTFRFRILSLIPWWSYCQFIKQNIARHSTNKFLFVCTWVVQFSAQNKSYKWNWSSKFLNLIQFLYILSFKAHCTYNHEAKTNATWSFWNCLQEHEVLNNGQANRCNDCIVCRGNNFLYYSFFYLNQTLIDVYKTGM